MNDNFNGPIVALATGTGNSGIGIIRLSGKDEIIQEIAKLVLPKFKPENRKAQLLSFVDQNQEQVDKVITLYFKAPNSYTGETVLEVQSHGGQVLLTWILEIVLEVGKKYSLRLADPGEFTERAFLNGKMDLVQAEAVADLIDASSRNAVRAASLSLNGEFSKYVHEVSELLVRLRIEVEAILDFPEEEIDFITEYNCKERLEEIIRDIKQTLEIAQQGETLRDGFKVALVGQTNAGKSSILNRLAGDEIAIVSDVAGTTRDKIQTLIHLNGIPFHITDTAGIRETSDKVEKIGIERAKNEISKSDIVVRVLDGGDPEKSKNDEKILSLVKQLTHEDIPILTVLNKSDLLSEDSVSRETEIKTSALTGEGINDLRNALLKAAGWKPKESVFIARKRHLDSLNAALAHLELAQELISYNDMKLELFAEELRLANDDLGSIVGKTTSDDLLGLIFKGFCIGK